MFLFWMYGIGILYMVIYFLFVYLVVEKYSKQNLLHCNKGSSITVRDFKW